MRGCDRIELRLDDGCSLHAMRILSIGNMYPPHSLGGYELMWSSWVGHTLDRGHEVRVLTTDFVKERGPVDAEEDYPGEAMRELRWYWQDHAEPRFSLLERIRIERHNDQVIRRWLDEFRPDAIVWWAMGGMSLAMIERARRARIPSLAVLADYWLHYAHDQDAWMRPMRRHRVLAGVVERGTGLITGADYTTITRFLAVSERVRLRALEAWPKLGEVAVCHHGPDTSLFMPAPVKSWRGRLLYVGRIDPRKGIDIAIRALSYLPETTLTVIGDGDEAHRNELEALVRTRNLGSLVRFESRHREKLPEAYADADAAMFPVVWAEPFGLVPLEAMAVGTPVVATGRGGSGEFLDDGRNCLIFDPCETDPEQGARNLAARVQELAGGASERTELRDRLREGGFATVAALSADRFNERALELVINLGEVEKPAG